MSKSKKSLDQYILSAWKQIVNNPPDALLHTIVEEVENRHSVRVTASDVTAFLESHVALRDSDEQAVKTPSREILRQMTWVEVDHDGKYKGKRPYWFQLAGQKVLVESWKDLLLKCGAVVAADNPKDFDDVLDYICGEGRKYFSRSKAELRDGRYIPGTNVYVETNLSANNTMSLCDAMCYYFGYGPNLVVQTV